MLDLPEMCHCISAPSWKREPHQPRFGSVGHGAPSTDSRLPVVAVVLRGIGCSELLFNQRCWCHEVKFFRYRALRGEPLAIVIN